ncbi:MAG: Gldg family protein [Cyanobacteria bacterium J06597_1]
MRRFSDWSAPIGLTAIAVGLALLLAGQGSFPITTALLVAGLVLVLLWVFTHLDLLRSFVGLRSTQSNLNAITSVVAVAVILIALNVVATRYSTQLDLSEAKLFTLAPQTQTVVEGLPFKVEVTIFSGGTIPEIRDRLEQFRRLNPEQFSFQFVDPDSNPGLARQLNLNARESIVVQTGDRSEQFPIPAPATLERVLTPTLIQLTNTEQRTVYFVQGHGEMPLEQQDNAAAMSQAIAALEEDGFGTAPLNLIERETVPADASVVVVAAPETAWLSAEVQSLQAYLNGGGRVLLLVNPIAAPELDALYEDWGVQLVDDVVVDINQISREFGQGPYIPLVTRYGDHPITTPLADKNLASFFPLARSLTAADDTMATALLVSGDRSWGETNLDDPNVAFDPETDIQGPLTLGLAFTRPATSPATQAGAPQTEESETLSAAEATTPEDSPEATDEPADPEAAAATDATTEARTEAVDDESALADQSESADIDIPLAETEPTETDASTPEETPVTDDGPDDIPADESDEASEDESRLVVIGNSQFAADGNFTELGNGDLFLNSINWLSNRTEAITIRPKSPTNRRFTISPAGVQWLRLLTVVLLPASALSFGAAQWWRRR